MSEVKYSEKLRDPRWQKKRLEVFERDNWRCRFCGNKHDTLMVHHCRYLSGKEPWDYPTELLITLCEDCDKTEKEDRQEAEERLISSLQTKFSAYDIDTIAEGFEQLNSDIIPFWLSLTLEWVLTSPEISKELCDRLNTSYDKALEDRKGGKGDA